MHILFIITDYGSFNNFLAELALHLRQEQRRVSVICSDSKTISVADKENYRESGIQFYFLPFPRSFNFIRQYLISLRIHRLVKTIKPDLVHIHFTTAMSTTLFAGRLPIYTMGTVHGLGYPTFRNPIKRWIFKRTEHTIIRRLDEFWVLNREDFQLLTKYHGEKIHLYRTAGIGCDTEKFNSQAYNHQKAPLRQQLHIAPEVLIYTFIGRFVYFKGFALVIKAFLRLATQYKDIHLLLIGGKDPLHNTGLDKAEERELFQHPAITHIPFTHEVAQYLAITDMMVFPSIKEGMPVSIMEALAMHVPVITSDTRGCNELIKDGVNGYLLSKNPIVDEIVQTMEQFYEARKRHNVRFRFDQQERSIARSDYVREQCKIYASVYIEIKARQVKSSE